MFRRITFPLLRPAHFFVATLLLIGGFKLFDQAIIAGGRGGEPNNALTTIVLFIYRSAITDSEFGYRGRGRHRSVRPHLHPDPRPAAALRAGTQLVRATR